MKGIELSEKFYNEYGAPMLYNEFPEIDGEIAVALCGSGSECFGYDDEISKDHDFEPGFCIFVPDNTDDKTLFNLERAYSSLPKEFMGYERSRVSPVGGSRHGVRRMGDFFLEKTGTPDGILSLKEWFFIPEQSLLEATNGKVFKDDSGEFTAIRERLSYMPEDVCLKKLAGNLLVMGQAGQYNYLRCASRGETGASQLAVGEFVKSAMNVIFLLNKNYIPYYKWSFRAMKNLSMHSFLCDSLEYLISSPNGERDVKEKADIIEKICKEIFDELENQGLTQYKGTEAEGHAYSVNNKISDGEIRNLHILYGV